MEMEKQVQILNIDDILPNRFQPRIKFNEKAITELAESIKLHGVIQPIVVRKISDKYEIIAGERRYKASILAGKTTIPAIVTSLDDKNSAEVALIENVQRQNLTPIEEAISYKKILDMGYINQETLGEQLGKTQSTIANKLRLLNLNEEVQEALMENKISERHARSLLKLNDEQQIFMLNRIINERMTVRKTDEEIGKMLDKNFNEQFEEIEEIKGDNIMNNDVLKEFNIPTEPIVDNDSKDILFEEGISSPDLQTSVETVNPGFMDIDKIKQEATDISIEPEPVADLDQLLKPTEQTVAPIEPIQQVEETEEDTTASGGKFFSMFNFHEQDKNDSFVSDLEETKANLDFESPIINTPNIFENPMSTPEIPTVDPLEQEFSNESNIFSSDIEESFQIADLPIEDYTVVSNDDNIEEQFTDFPSPVSSFNLTDDTDFTNSTIESSINDDYLTNQNIGYDEEGEIKVDIPNSSQKYVTADMKTVINTIRECASTIEKYGFKIETEEMDLTDFYQVTFKIDKNS